MEQWVTAWMGGVLAGPPGSAVEIADLGTSHRWTSLSAWAQELVRLAGSTFPIAVSPSLELRVRGFRAAISASPPGAPTSGSRIRLLVSTRECAVARADLLSPVFAWPSWDALKAYLADYGHDPGIIEEAISPISYGEAHSRVDPDRAWQYMREDLDQDLLGEVLRYFHDPLDAYLRSWQPLSDLPPGAPGEWEAFVPVKAVQRAEWPEEG